MAQQFNIKHDRLIDRKEAADYLGVSAQTLASWACTKRYQLRHFKIGRLVKYRLRDLDDFIESHVQNDGILQ